MFSRLHAQLWHMHDVMKAPFWRANVGDEAAVWMAVTKLSA
jgi:hypothetical protein